MHPPRGLETLTKGSLRSVPLNLWISLTKQLDLVCLHFLTGTMGKIFVSVSRSIFEDQITLTYERHPAVSPGK